MENIYSNQRLNIESEETIIIWPENQKEETIEEEDILEMAEILEINLEQNPYLKKFVIEALFAKLPENWRLYKNRKGEIFYMDILTKEIREENPIFVEIREKIKKYQNSANFDLHSEMDQSRFFGDLGSGKFSDIKENRAFQDNQRNLQSEKKPKSQFLFKKTQNGFHPENQVSLQSLDKNLSEKKEKKNFTFNDLKNNEVVLVKKETFSDFNNQLSALKSKIENLEKNIETNPNRNYPTNQEVNRLLNKDKINTVGDYLKNFTNKNHRTENSLNKDKSQNLKNFERFSNYDLSENDPKNLLKEKKNSLSKNEEREYLNKQIHEIYKKENQRNFEKDENYYVKEEFKLNYQDDYGLSKKEEFSKYSDPTYKSSASQHFQNTEFKTLKNEVFNLKSIIDKYIENDKQPNELVQYHSRKGSNLKEIYSPQKNFKRKIEHPNLTPFIQKSKESIIEKLDSFQKESEKKIFNLDFSNKRMKIIFEEKKKLEDEIAQFNKVKGVLKEKKKYLKNLKIKILSYINENKKNSKLFLDLDDTYKILKSEFSEKQNEFLKQKSVLNLKKKLLEKFEQELSSKNGTYDFYNLKIKEYYKEIENLEKIGKLEKNESFHILENDDKNNLSFSESSEKSKKFPFSLNSLPKNNSLHKRVRIQDGSDKKKNQLETAKPSRNPSLQEYGSVKNIIDNMQKKYKFQPKNEYYTQTDKPGVSSYTERKLNNSLISKISNKTFVAPINQMKVKSLSRESALKKRNFSNSIYSRQTTFFKDLRNEVDGILKSFNVNRFS